MLLLETSLMRANILWMQVIEGSKEHLPTPRIVLIHSGIVSSSNIPPSSSSVMLT